MIVVKAIPDDIDRMKTVTSQWKETCKGDKFCLTIDEKTHCADLVRLMNGTDSDVFLLLNDDGEVVGYMGVTIFKSPLSEQRMASHYYWYVLKEARGRGSMLLMKAVKEWAKEKSCTHLIMHASALASDLHDKMCGFYEKLGMDKFETYYISRV
jgi:GNAT superfamily N-acetyltransferase